MRSIVVLTVLTVLGCGCTPGFGAGSVIVDVDVETDTSSDADTDTDSANDSDTDSDADTDTEFKTDEDDLDVRVEDHVRECTQTCSTWRARNDLTLALRSAQAQTVSIEWTRSSINGVPQANWAEPIDATVVDLPADTEVLVELSGLAQQCWTSQSSVAEGLFELVIDGNQNWHIVAPSRFLSTPPPEAC